MDQNQPTTNSHQTEQSAPAQSKPRRARSRPLLIALLVIIVALLAGTTSVLGYKALFETTPAPKTTTTVGPDKVTESPANVLVDSLSHLVKGTVVPTTVDASNNIVTTKTGNFGLDGAPIAQNSDGSYFTAVATFSHLTVASSEQPTIADSALTADNFLLSQGLRAEATSWDGQTGDSTAHFHSDATRCTVSQTSLPLKQGHNQLTITCADVSKYDETTKTLQPVYDAYVKAKPDQKTASLYFYGLIADSQTDGYRTADIQTGNYFAPVGGSVALLYMTPDNQWHYFANSQDILPCDQYNTKQLKEAYAGTKCVDSASGKESSVTAR